MTSIFDSQFEQEEILRAEVDEVAEDVVSGILHPNEELSADVLLQKLRCNPNVYWSVRSKLEKRAAPDTFKRFCENLDPIFLAESNKEK